MSPSLLPTSRSGRIHLLSTTLGTVVAEVPKCRCSALSQKAPTLSGWGLIFARAALPGSRQTIRSADGGMKSHRVRRRHEDNLASQMKGEWDRNGRTLVQLIIMNYNYELATVP